MASIWKHPNSQYWTACFRDHNGNQRRITTKTTDRRKAQKIADAYEKVSRERHTRLHTQAVIDRLHEELGGEKIVRETLRLFAASWLATKKPETAPRTYAFYKKSVAKLLTFFGPKADLPISEITKSDLVGYRNSLTTKVSARTANHDLKASKMLFRAARRDGILAENPAEFVEGVRQRNGSQNPGRAFTIHELRAVLAVSDPEWRSMILSGIYTGQRLADIASLTWSNIDLEKGELRLVTAKTGKRLLIPLAAPLARHLEALASNDESRAPLHPRAHSIMQKHGRSAALSNQFGELLADAGLRARTTHKSTNKGRDVTREANQLSFHSLRRTATTLLHEAGIPAAVAQALIGHDSEAIHELYVSVGREALQKAANALPEVI
jgi:integrase